MKKITVVHGEQASAIYIDEKLFFDSSTALNPVFSLLQRLTELKISFEQIEFIQINDEWLKLIGYFPDEISDIVLHNESFEVLDENIET